MNAAVELGQGRAEALAWLASAAEAQESDRLIAPYLDAVAVLSTFKPDTVRPAGVVEESARLDALLELTNRSRIVDSRLGTWQLEENPRRAALRRLGRREAMRAARAANPDQPSDPLQEGIDRLIGSDTVPDLGGLTLHQLLGLERAVAWFEDILQPLPRRQELAARIERERQLAPMRKIAGDGFIDREDYLGQLTDYVGVLPAETAWRSLWRGIKYVAYLLDERPPLHLHGPGGMGKSALLARFILNHADPRCPQPLPFVYLDFDRAALDPRDPQTLVADAIRQLLVQFPWVDRDLLELGEEAREQSSNREMMDIARSRQFSSGENLIRRFCRLLSVVAEKNDQPVLLVLDTLEEAEYQGPSAMLVTWELLRDLLRRVDRLRIVTAGRSSLPPQGLPREPVELSGLPSEAAEQLVIKRAAAMSGVSVSAEDARDIVALVGTVPLSLLLAVRVVSNEGMDSLRDTVAKRTLFSRIKAEQQQGMLYRRILNHLAKHNPELEKVANPGLVLRRITPGIIEEVLAGPCGLELSKEQTTQHLFEELGREVGLVDPYREPGALWHLPAVRRIMLPDLRATLGATARAIHENAARYYHDRPNPTAIERAEEVYHLLWLGADTAALDQRWQPDLGPCLRSAYEEVGPQAKIWLANKFGIELEPELVAQADFDTWERQAEQRARTLMASGLISEALAALKERPWPSRPSTLYALEADALKLLGRIEEAQGAIAAGLSAADGAGDRGAMLPLVLRDAFLREATGDLQGALDCATRAIHLAESLHEPLDFLSAGAATLRIVRKMKGGGITEENARKSRLLLQYRALASFVSSVRSGMLELLKAPEVRRLLASRPALLREVAAEVGTDVPDLLAEAISLLGISSDDQVALLRYAKKLERPLDANQRKALDQLQRGPTSRGQGIRVATLVPAFGEFLAGRLAQAVEDSLRQTAGAASPTASEARGTVLTRNQRENLSSMIAKSFDRKELELLTLDSFDTHLDQIVTQGQPLRQQVHQLLRYAEKEGMLDKFVTRLARSCPDHPEIKSLMGDLSEGTRSAGLL